MAKENEHIAELKKGRDEFVDKRRKFATSSNWAKFIKVQSKIDAIDRAIADEEKNRSHTTRSGPLGE